MGSSLSLLFKLSLLCFLMPYAIILGYECSSLTRNAASPQKHRQNVSVQYSPFVYREYKYVIFPLMWILHKYPVFSQMSSQDNFLITSQEK